MIIKTIMLITLLIVNVMLLFSVAAYAWLRWYIWKHKDDELSKEDWKLMT